MRGACSLCDRGEEEAVGGRGVLEEEGGRVRGVVVVGGDDGGEELTDDVALFFFRQLFLIINLRSLITLPQILPKTKSPQQIIPPLTLRRNNNLPKPRQLPINPLLILLTKDGNPRQILLYYCILLDGIALVGV